MKKQDEKPMKINTPTLMETKSKMAQDLRWLANKIEFANADVYEYKFDNIIKDENYNFRTLDKCDIKSLIITFKIK